MRRRISCLALRRSAITVFEDLYIHLTKKSQEIDMDNYHNQHVYRQTLIYLIAMPAILLFQRTEACREYGATSVSQCSPGFPSAFEIDKALRNTELTTVHRRQTLIPDINFACNGAITQFLFGAEWQGFTSGFTEFQVWRQTSETGSAYRKVDGVTIKVSSKSGSGLYEYQVDPPLEFKHGDIFGYFQPSFDRSQLNLNLENTNRTTTYQYKLCQRCVYPPPVDHTYSLDTLTTDTRYPVISITTDPPHCGCGFMSMERVMQLFSTNTTTTKTTNYFPINAPSVVLLPSLTFTCSVTIVKWTVAGTHGNPSGPSAKIHLWRRIASRTSFYEMVDETETILSPKKANNVNEFVPVDSLLAQPGDIVGIFIPENPIFIPSYNSDDMETVYYWTVVDEHHPSLVNASNMTSERGGPLITVETQDDGSSTGSFVGGLIAIVFIGLIVLAVTATVIIIISVVVNKKRKRGGRTAAMLERTRAGSGGVNILDRDLIHQDTLYSIPRDPTILTSTTSNVAYNVVSCYHEDSGDTLTTPNPAYHTNTNNVVDTMRASRESSEKEPYVAPAVPNTVREVPTNKSAVEEHAYV